MREQFAAKSNFPISRSALFRFHANPGAFERLNPPWAPAKILFHEGIANGAKVTLRVPVGPLFQNFICQTWSLVHEGYREGEQFCDRLQQGPFPYWLHTHRFLDDTNDHVILEDAIEYELPLGAIGRFFGSTFTQSTLQRVFAYRHFVTRSSIVAHKQILEGTTPPMRVAISGISGLIGSSLAAFLASGSHQVYGLKRPGGSKTSWPEISWEPHSGFPAPEQIDGVDAIIHLAGENIAARRWTPEVRKRLIESRINPTRILAESLAKLPKPPKVLIAASAVGFYGATRHEEVTEESSVGEGFLAELTSRWEEATEPARAAGIRVVNLRIGIVLDPRGGMLGKLLPVFLAGGGGTIGSGAQSMSWIALEDLLRIINFALLKDISGPINAVAPTPCTNLEFTRALAGLLHRPAILPAPRPILEAVFGDMAAQVILADQKVLPRVLQAADFEYIVPELGEALALCLGRRPWNNL